MLGRIRSTTKWVVSWSKLLALATLASLYHVATHWEATTTWGGDGDSNVCWVNPTSEELLVDPHLPVIDTEVHLNDPHAIPRRGSLGLKLLSWIPDQYSFSMVALASYPRPLLLALNGEMNGQHILETYDREEFEMDAQLHNVSGFVAMESGSHLSPQGQEANTMIHMIEARWLNARSKSFIAFAGPERMPSSKRLDYIGQVKSLPHFRGVRWAAAFSDSPMIHSWASTGNPRLHLAELKHLLETLHIPVVDLLLFHPQLSLAGRAAKKFPNTTFVISHAGGPFMCGRPLLDCEEYIEELERLSALPNVVVKISGLANVQSGLGYHVMQPTQADLQNDWGPLILWLIGKFGIDRVLFGSNAPFDLPVIQYDTYWNTIKAVLRSGNFTLMQKELMLSGNAKRIYNL